MRFIQALVALGLFGWLGYAVYTDTLPGTNGGSGKTRALAAMVSSATEKFGVAQTSLGLFGIGVALALFFLMRRRSHYD